MPEFMGKKITKAEESARHGYRRALETSIRTQVKGTGWKSVGGSIFREKAGWFFRADPIVYVYEHVTKLAVSAKPMAIDPILWELLGLHENCKQSLSFRANGVFTCRPRYFEEQAIEENDYPSIVADRFIAAATEKYENILHTYSLDTFLIDCRDAAGRTEHYLPCLVATLIAMHREGEALAVCEEALARGASGGILFPGSSFVEMAANRLRHRNADTV